LLRVPLTATITAETALRSDIGQWILEFEPQLADYAFIALALLHEERLAGQSAYAPFLETLPSSPDVPLLWDDDLQLEFIQSTAAPLSSRLEAVVADFNWLCENVFAANPVIFPDSVFSFESYCRALGLAYSRCLTVSDADGYTSVALIPFFDLPNHDDDASADVESVAAKQGLFGSGGEPACVQLVATRDLNQGEDVSLTYSLATRGELMLDYGFLQEPVPAESSLTFAIDEEDMNYDDKCDVLEEAGLLAESTFIIDETEPAPEFLAFLRLKHLKGADAFLLEAIFRNSVWEEHVAQPVSEENERAANTEGLERCNTVVSQLRGTVQGDLAVLAEAPKESYAYRFAAVRYAERRSLQAACRYFQARLGTLGGLEYYQERRLRSLNLTPVESEEDIEALRVESMRSAGRSLESNYEW